MNNTNRRLMETPLLHWYALEQDESLPVQELLLDRPKEGRKLGQGKQGLRHARQRCSGGNKVVRSSAQLRNLFIAEDMGPSLRIVAILFGFPDGRAYHLLGEVRVRSKLGVDWIMLSRGFEAIWEDGLVNDELVYQRR